MLSAPEGGGRKKKNPPLSKYTQSKQMHLKAVFVIKITMIKLCGYPVITEPGFGNHAFRSMVCIFFSYA